MQRAKSTVAFEPNEGAWIVKRSYCLHKKNVIRVGFQASISHLQKNIWAHEKKYVPHKIMKY